MSSELEALPRRRISREVRARDMVFGLSSGAACKGESAVWAEAEVAHAQARSKRAAGIAAMPALVMCDTCPVVKECRAWARMDSYTGLAAGQAWISGRPRPVEWTNRQRWRVA